MSYVFIFLLKNPASLDDNFWGTIVGIYAAVFSLVAIIALMLVPQRHPIFYYACADLDPRPDYKHGKLFYTQLEIIATIFIHIILISRIQFYKWSRSNGESSAMTSYLNESSLASLALNSVLITWSTFSISVQVVINKIDLDDTKKYLNYLFMCAYQLLLPPLTIFVISFGFYLKHKHLRIQVLNKILELFKA